MTCDESWIYCYDTETKRQSSENQEGQTEQIHPQTFDDPFFDSTVMIYTDWVFTGQTVNKEYYVEVLWEVRKRFRRKRPALFKSAQRHFHQDNAPVHNSILVTDYLTKMGIKTVRHPPDSPNLAPCEFWLSPKLRGCHYDTIEEMKKSCDEGHWHTHTRGLPCGLPEFVRTVQQVHFSWSRFLRRGVEFHVCNINKSVHTKKVWKSISWSSYVNIVPSWQKQFSSIWYINISYINIWYINNTLSGAITLGQSWSGSNGNEGVLRIPQSSRISGTSPSDCLVSYQETCCGVVLPLQKKQLMYFTVSINWAISWTSSIIILSVAIS